MPGDVYGDGDRDFWLGSPTATPNQVMTSRARESRLMFKNREYCTFGWEVDISLGRDD